MQTRSQHFELEEINLEIERSCRKICTEKREKDRIIADQGAIPARTLGEYGVPSLTGSQNCIVKPSIDVNTFEIKPAYIQMVSQYQFAGLPSEDPNAYLASFLDICDTFQDEWSLSKCYQTKIIFLFPERQSKAVAQFFSSQFDHFMGFAL